MTENRASKRVAVAWRAIVFEDGQKLTAKVVNVSSIGIGLVLDRSYAVGTQLEVAMLVPNAEFQKPPVVVECQVRVSHSVFRAEGCLLGLDIRSIAPQHKKLIDKWIASH